MKHQQHCDPLRSHLGAIIPALSFAHLLNKLIFFSTYDEVL